MPSKFALHVAAWDGCQRCLLAAGRTRVCHARGSIPADVFFVGEAPGESEDALGVPFAGPAGKLLDHIIARALPQATRCPECGNPCFVSDGGITCREGHGGLVGREEFQPGVRFAVSNLVGCVPRPEGQDSGKTEEPPDEAITACAPRLQELCAIVSPRLVVAVGSLARDWLVPGYKHSIALPGNPRQADILHPAAMLRAVPAQQGFLIRRATVTIRSAWEEVADAHASR